MSVLNYYSFEGSSSIPGTLNVDSGQSIDTGSAVSGGGANSFLNVSGTTKNSLNSTMSPTGDSILSLRFKVLNAGVTSVVNLIQRCDDSNPANLLTTASSMRASIPIGSTEAAINSFRLNAGTAHAMLNRTLTGLPLSAGETYLAYFSLSGLNVKLEIQQITGTNAGKWLNAAGTDWQTGRVACLDFADSAATYGGTTFTGAGYWGWRITSVTGSPNSSVFIDEVRLSNSAVVSVTPSTASIAIAGTTTLTAVNFPGGSWSSADPTIATVNSSTGVVTGVASGSVSITYTSSVDPSETASALITVASALTSGTLTAGAVTSSSIAASIATNAGGTSPYSNQLQVSPHSAGSWTNNGSPVTGATGSLIASGLSAATQYDLRVIVTDAASATSTSNTVTGTTSAGSATIAVNDSLGYRTTGNIDVRSSVLAVANYMGATFRQGFTGTSIGATFDVSTMVTAGLGTSQYPKVAYSIDRGPWQVTRIAASKTFASGLSPGNHWIEMELVSFDRSVDNWSTPVSALYLTAWIVDAGANSVALPADLQAKSRIAVFWGNSMTAGIYTIFAGGAADIDASDSRYSWAKQVAAAFNLDPHMCAVGGTQIAGDGGNGGFPRFWDSATPANSTYRKYSASRTRASLLQYTDHFFEFGVIEATDPSSAIVAMLANYRPLTTVGSLIWIGIPFGGHWRSQITAAIAAYRTSSGDTKCFVLDNGSKGEVGILQTGTGAGSGAATRQAWDGYHPNADNQANQGAMRAQLIDAALVTPPAATSYLVKGIPPAPVVGTTYTVTVVLDNPASALGVVTPANATGITWGSPVSLAQGAVSGDTTVTFTATGTYTPAFSHTGLGFAGNPTLPSVTAGAGGGGGDPSAIANAVINLLYTTALATPLPSNQVQIAGSTIAATNLQSTMLADPVEIADIADASASATATLVGKLNLNIGTILGSPGPTNTTFSATVTSQDGATNTTTSGGFVGMNLVIQGAQNFKRKVTSHAVSGTTHNFVIDSDNPFPSGFLQAGMTFVIG